MEVESPRKINNKTMQTIDEYFAAKQKVKADKIVFIGFVVMIVAATVTYLIK